MAEVGTAPAAEVVDRPTERAPREEPRSVVASPRERQSPGSRAKKESKSSPVERERKPEEEGDAYDDAATLRAAAATLRYAEDDVTVEDSVEMRRANGNGGGGAATATAGDGGGDLNGGEDDDEVDSQAALRREMYARLPPAAAAQVREADTYVALGSRHFIESGFDHALESFAKALELRQHALGRAHALTAAAESDCGVAADLAGLPERAEVRLPQSAAVDNFRLCSVWWTHTAPIPKPCISPRDMHLAYVHTMCTTRSTADASAHGW